MSKVPARDPSPEEEDGPDLDKYEEDFVDDAPMEQDTSHKKKRKRVKTEAPKLEEDDYDLIRENTGRQKKRRLKKELDELSSGVKEMKLEDHDRFIDDDAPASHFAQGVTKIRTGVTSETLKLAEEIFPDEDEEMEDVISPKKEEEEDIKQIFKRERELHKDIQTEKDRQIVGADVPERLSERLEGRMTPTDSELEQEALWILNIISRDSKFEQAEMKALNEKIFKVIEAFRKHHLDIPFIIFYRGFFFEPELSRDDVWKIYELDLEWESFYKTRTNLQTMFIELKPYLDDPSMLEESLKFAND